MNKKNKPSSRGKSFFQLIRLLSRMVDIRKVKRYLIIYGILILIIIPVELIILPFLVVSKLSAITSQTHSWSIGRLVLLFFLIFAFLKVLGYLRYRLAYHIQTRMYIDVKQRMIEDIMEKYGDSKEELPLGRIINHLENVPHMVEQIFYKLVGYLIPEIICLVSVVVFLFWIDRGLGMIVLVFIISYIIYGLSNMLPLQEKAEKEANYRARHNQGVLNIMDNMLYILVNKSFGYEKRQFHRKNEGHYRCFMECESVNSRLHKYLNYISIFFLGLLCLRLYYLMIQKGISRSQLVKYGSVFVVLILFMEKLYDFKFMFMDIGTLVYKSKVFLQDIDIPITHLSNPSLKRPPSISSRYCLEIKGLCYYNTKYRHQLFQNQDFRFRRNQITALLGESGSGKSTLAKIILGLISPDRGDILVSGREIGSVLRQMEIGYIPQQVKLFEGSVLDNIRYTCHKDISRNQVEKWVRDVGLEHIFKKDKEESHQHYLDKPVGIAGSELSGGQRQLLVILRTLIANTCLQPPKSIFILDEPTSALDAQTSQIIFDLLLRFSKRYSFIIITHDLKFAKLCHHTIYMDKSIR